MRADQILVEYFGLNTTVSPKIEDLISKYQKLFSKEGKTSKDKTNLERFGKQLEKYNYNLAESVRDIEMQKKLLKIIEIEKKKDD